jgi:hypothetical protein
MIATLLRLLGFRSGLPEADLIAHSIYYENRPRAIAR